MNKKINKHIKNEHPTCKQHTTFKKITKQNRTKEW